MKSYVLITTEPSEEHNVYLKLKENKKITEVHPLFGEYDLIISIDTDDFESLGNIITNEIRTVKGIIHTKTLTGTISW